MRFHLGNKGACLLALLLWFALFSPVLAQNYPTKPSPARLVNDFAKILTAEENQTLENKLVAFDDSTSTQISIVTLSDLEGNSASAYAVELAQKWGIGQKGSNNGILILVSMGNPREMFIATGYGVEEYVPDAVAKQIVSNHIIPAFKQGNYYEGLDLGTSDLMQCLKGTFKGFGKKKYPEKSPYTSVIIVIVIIILVIIFSRNNKGGGNGYSRTFGAPFIGGFPRGGGGGFGGGGSGGFGGFGGGGFGGGGAGGSW